MECERVDNLVAGATRTLLAEAAVGFVAGGVVDHLYDERSAGADGGLDDVELEA